VAPPPTALADANLSSDPRRVVTPLIPERLEELLYLYDIHDDWKHILAGLREGFDVGIRGSLPCSRTLHSPTVPHGISRDSIGNIWKFQGSSREFLLQNNYSITQMFKILSE
jgi:hypothetical protein